MKRVFHHPPESRSSGGKRYWRSLGEYSDSPEFRQWLEREFPQGIAELTGNEWSRRDFLKLMGASMALAGVGLTSCRRPELHLVPFTRNVEWTIPGKFLYYATAMPRRTGAIPLLATTVDGRPIKLEGNPLHPASAGATDTFIQASILDLYDPTRSKRFVRNGKTSKRTHFEAYITELHNKVMADHGDGLAFLVEETNSPTRERLRGELEKKLPEMRWCVYEPFLSQRTSVAAQTAFGPGARAIPKFDRADIIVALDSDFLDCGQGDLASVRAFTSRRRVSAPKDSMNRLYVIENRFTLTGAMADHRLRCPASQVAAVTHALAAKILAGTNDSALGSVMGSVQGSAAFGGDTFDEQWITGLANDLMAKPGASLVLAGPSQPVSVQLLAYAINAALKNLGQTLVVRQLQHNPRTIDISQLARDINDGRIKHLFILGGDPVYNAPRGLVEDKQKSLPLDWAELQNRVPEIVRLGYHEDVTSTLSQWHLPAAHYLESWGDALTANGDYLSIQPMILPIFGGLSESELLSWVLGFAKTEGPELVQETFRATNPPGDFQTAWSRFLHDGFAAHVQPHDQSPSFNAGAAAMLMRNSWTLSSVPTAESPEIVLTGSYAMDDGRYANNGWLQELPDPITKLTWDNAALMSPAFAKKLGVLTGDLLQITINEKSAGGQPVRRELVIAALVSPGHAENSVTVSLGYARKMPQFDSLPYAGGALKELPKIAEQSGFNGYFLLTAANPHFAVAGGQGIESVRVTKVGRTYPFSITQEQFSIEGRGLVREATLDGYRENNEFAKKIPGEEELPHPPPSIYTHPPLDAPQQWGMSIDLNVCTGCSACVIACQAENNVPVVGKLQVSHGRIMHWLRIDRYYASRKPYNQDRGEWPENPEIVHQPMPCQHCENAPCETVCPVNATIHSEDGLNVMAYNRCVGTRFCSNNCPYKVRRFNYFDYNQRPVGKRKIVGALNIYEEYFAPLTTKGAPDTIKMQKNPNVTVRMRGVMEKCTFCVQRIEEAKIAALARAGASPETRIPRDSFTTACAQACPTEAIVFGDIKDPESRVSKMKQQDRNYRILDYLNVVPRVSYLARIRNPNPKMPDAENIGVASFEEKPA
ncbi:MAG TPA: TAT-variant-translocated molybdopterin oxidoreductase [Candidatus Udaeobacter sp.]|nr:TAT-variant-translocated molybdopterin oxidoreductase [Candidatus Udaeobacter sp.]